METKLTPEQNELVAVGASVGAGCHPCVDHHLKAGGKAGLDGGRLLAAVTSAERVTAAAAVRMADHLRVTLGSTEPALLSRVEEALASLGAALGANDATNIERQLRTALGSGATRPQLEQAIATARTVQENAARIHLRHAERLLDTLAVAVAAPEDEVGSDEGCCGANDENAPTVAGAAAADPPPTAARANPDDDSATDRANEPAAARAAMAGLFASAGAGEMTGIAAAMASCARMFEGGRRGPAAAAETDDATATEAAGPCRKEA